MDIRFLFLLFLAITVNAKKNLTIHMIPHSHNDAGWLMSMDQYFRDYTSRILDSVTKELLKDEYK